MYPRIPEAPFNHAIWFTLESIATYAPYTCLVLQTSSCNIMETVSTENPPTFTQTQQVETVAQVIYNRSLPLFRRMMEQGQVRITILNHSKYKLKSCSDFFNPSSALMNIHYWQDEFIDNVDSHMILVIQDGAVLCHPFDIHLWNDVAMTGALWPKDWPATLGWCEQIRMLWRMWNRAQAPKRLRQGQPQSTTRDQIKLQHLCSDGYGPTGSGGFSLRNKNWMIRVIQTCPYLPYSGTSGGSTGCKVRTLESEDLYFATALIGLRAPMPSAYEGALFSTQMLWPEEADEIFGPYTPSQRDEFITKRWGSEGLSMYKRMHNTSSYGDSISSSLLRTVSIGLHKPWNYQPNDILVGAQVAQECKFLKYIFDPSMSTYDGTTWRFKTIDLTNTYKKRAAMDYAHPKLPIQKHEGKAAPVSTSSISRDPPKYQITDISSLHEPIGNSTIPHILWFTYKYNILLSKQPEHLYQNVLNTINAYATSFQEQSDKHAQVTTQVLFLDDQQCYNILERIYPQLASHFLNENNGAFKGDICRVAALYLYGGYYFDVDMGVVTPYIVDDTSKTSFVSVRDSDESLFQSFVASTARNPILKEAFKIMMDYYEGRHKTCTVQNSCLMGTRTLMDAFQSVTASDYGRFPGGSITTVLLRQDQLRPNLYPALPRHKRPGCNFIVHDPQHKVVHFYSRIEGSSSCPFSTTDIHDSPCGGGVVGNSVCDDESLCCSPYGWCGKSPAYCGVKRDK